MSNTSERQKMRCTRGCVARCNLDEAISDTPETCTSCARNWTKCNGIRDCPASPQTIALTWFVDVEIRPIYNERHLTPEHRSTRCRRNSVPAASYRLVKSYRRQRIGKHAKPGHLEAETRHYRLPSFDRSLAYTCTHARAYARRAKFHEKFLFLFFFLVAGEPGADRFDDFPRVISIDSPKRMNGEKSRFSSGNAGRGERDRDTIVPERREFCILDSFRIEWNRLLEIKADANETFDNAEGSFGFVQSAIERR